MMNYYLNLQILSLAGDTIKLVASILHQRFAITDTGREIEREEIADTAREIKHEEVTETAPVITPSLNWSSLPEYSLDQVSWHSYSDDCWIVIRDKVYDVTKFIHQVH